jgi:uncharacterized protein YecT (DUF1311 family)
MSPRFRPALLIVSMSGLLFAANPGCAAIASQPNPEDVTTIDACVADARAAKTDPDACIGRVFGACAKTASTAPAIEECNDRELRVWQTALNRDYAQLATLLPDDNAKQALRDAERDFLVYQLKQCTFERVAHRDSPDALAAAARCTVKATARQDLWLLDQISSFKTH